MLCALPGPRCQSSNSFSSGQRSNWPVAATPRGPSAGQVRSERPGNSTYRPTQRQQTPRLYTPVASDTAWNQTPVQQPLARSFGKYEC